MIEKVFVDTNAFIALSSKNDQFHKQAKELNQRLLQEGCQYITSNFIIDETLTGIMMKIGHYAAVDFFEKTKASKLIEIIHVNEQIEHEAWKVFKKYSDKSFSFTDCTSFVIMKELNIIKAFTNDHHFEQMRFERLIV